MRGDYVYVRRRTYSHHGTTAATAPVIHCIGERRATRWIERTSWEEFAGRGRVLVRTHSPAVPADEIVANAESGLGDGGYRLVRNNCEHFATWSSTGSPASSQVRRWAIAAPGAVVSVGTVEVAGPHPVLLGSLSIGLLALTRPRRRTRQGAGARV